MKKRLFALVLVLALGLSGCGDKSADDSDKQVETSTENTDEGTEKTGKSILDIIKGETTTEETAQELPVVIIHHTALGSYNKNYETYMTVEYDTVSLDEESAKKYPLLAETLKVISEEIDAQNNDFYDTNVAEAKNGMESGYGNGYENTDSLSIVRSDGKVLTFSNSGYSYMDGAHGYYATTGINIDVTTGKKLVLSDLISDRAALLDLLIELLDEQYEDELYDDFGGLLRDYYSDESNDFSWILNDSGVEIIFNPYEIAPYASGQQFIDLSFADYPQLFNDTYTACNTGYIKKIEGYTMYDYDGDGKKEELCVACGYANEGPHEEWDDLDCWKIFVKDKVVFELTDRYFYEGDKYLIHTKDGSDFLILEETLPNDYSSWIILKLHDGVIEMTSEEFGYYVASEYYEWSDYDVDTKNVLKYGYKAFYNPDNFTLGLRLDILGTSSGVADYKLTEEGKIERISDALYYDTEFEYNTVTVAQNITGHKVSEDGKIAEETVVPKGNKVTAYRTDSETFIDVKLANGSLVRFDLTVEDYTFSINGNNIYDLFTDLMWAG